MHAGKKHKGAAGVHPWRQKNATSARAYWSPQLGADLSAAYYFSLLPGEVMYVPTYCSPESTTAPPQYVNKQAVEAKGKASWKATSQPHEDNKASLNPDAPAFVPSTSACDVIVPAKDTKRAGLRKDAPAFEPSSMQAGAENATQSSNPIGLSAASEHSVKQHVSQTPEPKAKRPPSLTMLDSCPPSTLASPEARPVQSPMMCASPMPSPLALSGGSPVQQKAAVATMTVRQLAKAYLPIQNSAATITTSAGSSETVGRSRASSLQSATCSPVVSPASSPIVTYASHPQMVWPASPVRSIVPPLPGGSPISREQFLQARMVAGKIQRGPPGLGEFAPSPTSAARRTGFALPQPGWIRTSTTSIAGVRVKRG
eukprot:TRINITY_DN82568_c0_g1_i1.p1 TRINITY_DN82568_c0_g1~~TRINITY_DN82568_c0_g1_i1.p1  ORF type:complete len:371 (-),score=50.37 TRINITY_DN82568_c0_g1_i1:80-1192(-)